MNPGRKIAARFVLAVGAMSLLAGCTVKSTKLFEGSPAEEVEEWRSGDELYVQSRNGAVVVDTGADQEIVAEVTPFVLLAHDATDEEARDELEKLELTISTEEANSASGTRIVVNLERNGQVKSSLGGDLDIQIPKQFDGRLRIAQDNGPTEIRDAGGAIYIEVASGNGSCDLNVGSPSVVDVECGNGGLEASVSGIPEDFSRGSFVTGNGDIDLALPSDGTYRVVAESKGGGLVDTGNAVSSGCTVDVDSDSKKTISCGGATADSPTYAVTTEGSLGHEVTLSFG